MRNIGLITFCDNTNYGSFLQTYALYKYVERMGISIELIDYRKKVPDYERMTIGGIRRIIQEKGYDYGIPLIINIVRMQISFDRLISKTMTKSRKYTNKTIKKCRGKYKILLVGSDLVWDLRYAGDYTYMLDFADDTVRKIAYAASYGYESIPEIEREKFREKLSLFQQITVREKNEKEDLQKLLEKTVLHVCDPTMLMENEFWLKFIQKNKRCRKYVVIYMPDSAQKLTKEAKRYARRIGAEIYFVDKAVKERCPKNPEDFLTLLYYAEKVFTASYHGLLFSIYFKKEFAFAKRQPSNRLDSLEEVLGLEEYNIFSKKYNREKKVDYKKIKLREQEFREKSRNILKGIVLDESR